MGAALMAEGIEVRVAKDGTRTYRASVWSNRERKLIRKSFPSEAAAKTWRHDAHGAVKSGRMRAAAAPTLAAAVEQWKAGAEAGTIRTRGRRVFAPSTIRAVEQNYRLRVADAFGRERLDRITLPDVQELVDRSTPGTSTRARSRARSCRCDSCTATPARRASCTPTLRMAWSCLRRPVEGVCRPLQPMRRDCSPRRASRTRPYGLPRCSPAFAAAN
jgi:hypothetical protein